MLSQIPRTENADHRDGEKRGVALASAQLKSLAARGGLQRAAAEINKFMPQRNEGDHVTLVQALAGDDPIKVRQQEIELFVYQLSNDLIENSGGRYVDEMDKYSKIMELFENISLPLVAWKRYFIQSREEATGIAFTEKLFEAAVITRSLSLCEALLESEADPDRPIRSINIPGFVRPIQHSIHGRADDAALAKLLVRFGAGVDLATTEHTTPALLTAAREGFTECVRVLVEAGANMKVARRERRSTSRVAGDTPLSYVAEGTWRRGWPLDNNEGHRGLSCLKYLLPLYDSERDHEIIQDTLMVAARSHSTVMIPVLVEAGADVNHGVPNGHTPLTQAVSSCSESYSITAVQTLLDLGADPNRPFGLPAASNVCPLHIAAACGKVGVIRLLVESGADLDARAVPSISRHASIFGDYSSIDRISYPATPLWLLMQNNVYGIGKGYAESALYMLRAGASLTGGELARAPMMGSSELVRELLARGADINEVDRDGRTALQNAIDSAHRHLVTDLLEAGAEIREGDVLTAIRRGSRANVEVLLRHGARLDYELGAQSILEAALSSGGLGFMIWMMQNHAVPYHPVALCAAVCSGLHLSDRNEQQLETLLRARNPSKPGGLLTATAIGHAAYCGDSWILERLLTFKTQSTCLIPLSDGDQGYYRITEGWEVNMDYTYWDPFSRGGSYLRTSVLVPAILAANWDETRLLLDAGHKPDRLTLFAAVAIAKTYGVIDYCEADYLEEFRRESLGIIRRLTKLLASKDISQPARRNLPTPLQIAAKSRRVDVARHLLSLGADVNAPPSKIIDLGDGEASFPRTAFQAAVETGETEMIELLLDAGADVHAAPGYDSGATALQLAAGNGYIGIVRRLIALGADVNATGAPRRGRTALQAAAERGRLDMVQFLLECGAATVIDRSTEAREAYWRARGLARRNGHVAVDGLLRKYEEQVAATGYRGGFDTYVMASDESCSSDEDEDDDEDEDEDGYYSPEEDGSIGDDEGWSEEKGVQFI